MLDYNIITIEECDSTNNVLTALAREGAPHGTVVTAVRQTAGRGQRGNSRESEPGKNLTFSLLIRPGSIAPHDQFRLSEAVALGIADALHPLLPGHEVKVKWPNDIYVGDKKICGTLIENSITASRISHSIAGTGINVNQRRFLSDAPNPVSIAMLTGNETALRELLDAVVTAILRRLSQPWPMLHTEYMESLWRRDGGRYRDSATGEEFQAAITDVAPSGLISLLDSEGQTRVYAFKEVQSVIS